MTCNPSCGPDIIVRGLPVDRAAVMTSAIEAIIGVVREQGLDLANFDAVIVTDDYDAEQARISKETGKPVSYTNEEYVRGIAQVLKIRRHDGSFGMTVVMDRTSADGLIGEHETARLLAIHLFHHELCHVHDDNKHRACLPDYFLKQAYTGTDQHFGPLTELIWSEYFANRHSCTTATNEVLSLYAKGLADTLPLTEQLVEEAVMTYQCHDSDLNTLIETATRHIRALLMLAAYVQGYIAGLNTTLEGFSTDLYRIVKDSYFWDTWQRIEEETEMMHATYPKWSSPAVYDRHKKVVSDFFAQMGLVFSMLEDNTMYVDVPLDLEKIERVQRRLAAS